MTIAFSYARGNASALAAALVLAALVAGCAGVDVDRAPFTDFSSSLQPLRAATDAQAALAAEASRQELIDSVDREETSPADLQLDFDAGGSFSSTYGFMESEPMFVKLNRFRQGLSALNDAMIAYAQSLVILASANRAEAPTR